MHPRLISQLIADRQGGLAASARQQRLARQARAAQRGRAAPMLAALGRLRWRRSSPRTLHARAAGPGQAALTPREPGLPKPGAQGLANPAAPSSSCSASTPFTGTFLASSASSASPPAPRPASRTGSSSGRAPGELARPG
jgi:hypothetical protein